MEKHKKCSTKKHIDINAISFCLECNIFMCNKCANYHNVIFEQHHKYNSNENLNDILLEFAKKKTTKIH